MNLKIRFTGKALPVIEEALGFAKESGTVKETRYKEFNGDIYLDIPENEVDLWLDLFAAMQEDEDCECDPDDLNKVAEVFVKHADEVLGDGLD